MKEKRGREERKTGREGRVGGECVSFTQSDNSDFQITGFRSNLSQILAILLNTQPPTQPSKFIYIYIYLLKNKSVQHMALDSS